MVKNFKNMKILQVGTRVKPFKSIMYNELELAERFGIDIVAFNLAEALNDLKEIYDSNSENFLFFNKMKSPVKRINGKYRYQALMRLCGDYQEIKDKIYEKSIEKSNSKVLVYVEENPSNLY
jgi:L-fucose isomerase-like protein